MQYRVELTKKAVKQLQKIPRETQVRIFQAIRRLENSENWGDVKTLVNHGYDYRMRVGNYRVLFDVCEDGTLRVVLIREVKKRDERTY
ncbi:MAG: type II toxin-antitoxin system RelE/ParE family toxin [Planctomycetia bacterium]|nr:type II toxin-antitoxin system RelE/ParE family toxin [Planctomycetia bacterium]